MPAYPLRALVLRQTRLGETDTIVTLLAADGTPVRAVAKGLRRPGSRFGGRLEPYALVDLLMHTGKSLEVISEARTVEAHAGLRSDLDRTAAAAVVVDLIDKLAVEGQSDPKIYDAAVTTLAVFEAAPVERLGALVVAFLVKALAVHGYRPELDYCVACAQEAPQEGRAALSLSQGGVLCPECGHLDAAALSCPAEARAWLQALLSSTMAEVAALQMPPAAVCDCFALVRAFVNYHVPTRLKALDFFAGCLVQE